MSKNHCTVAGQWSHSPNTIGVEDFPGFISLRFPGLVKTLFPRVANTVGFVCLAKPADADVMLGGLITFAKIAPSGKNPDHIMAVG